MVSQLLTISWWSRWKQWLRAIVFTYNKQNSTSIRGITLLVVWSATLISANFICKRPMLGYRQHGSHIIQNVFSEVKDFFDFVQKWRVCGDYCYFSEVLMACEISIYCSWVLRKFVYSKVITKQEGVWRRIFPRKNIENREGYSNEEFIDWWREVEGEKQILER